MSEFTILNMARIAPGEYSFIRAEAGYRRAAGRLFRPGIDVNFGSFYEGWRLMLNFSPRWNLSKHFELEASWLYNLVYLPSEPQRFDAHIGQLRVRTALNTQLSANVFFQVNSSSNWILTNIRFRYNFRDGNDLWIIYNEGMHTNRHREDLLLPRLDTRVLMAKYTHTFHASK